MERPVAAAGVVPLWSGVGQGWLMVDEVLPDRMGLLLAMRRGLREIVESGPFHRVQADVRKDFLLGQRLLRVLGFTEEGPLWAYSSDGVDHVRFSLVSRELIDS